MHDAVVRDAGPGDVARLAGLERALFGAQAWDEAALRAELDGPGRRLLVLDVRDRPVAAYAATMVVGDVADLLRIGVDPARQGRGLARVLLGAAVDHARAAGADRLLLEVAASNEPALALYRGAGMVELDRRRGYYRGTDALVLGLALS